MAAHRHRRHSGSLRSLGDLGAAVGGWLSLMAIVLASDAGAVNAQVTVHYYDGLYHEIFNEPEQETVLADTITWLDSVTS